MVPDLAQVWVRCSRMGELSSFLLQRIFVFLPPQRCLEARASSSEMRKLIERRIGTMGSLRHLLSDRLDELSPVTIPTYPIPFCSGPSDSLEEADEEAIRLDMSPRAYQGDPPSELVHAAAAMSRSTIDSESEGSESEVTSGMPNEHRAIKMALSAKPPPKRLKQLPASVQL